MNTPIDESTYTTLVRLAEELQRKNTQLDAQHCLPEHVARTLTQEGLWKLWVPEDYGGAELALPESLHLFETAARLEPVLGWSVTIGTGGGLFAAWLADASARTIFSPAHALVAGSGAPTGTATPVAGGYRVSGRWRYASGAPHASWFTASTVIEGETVDGRPLIRAVAVPAAQVVIEDSWDTAALQGTGSHDIRMEEVFVPTEFSFDLFAPPRIDRPLYRFPFMSIAEASFGAVALGYARGALDAFSQGPARRRPMGGEKTAAEFEAVQIRYAEAEMRLRAARAYFYQAVVSAWQQVLENRPVASNQQQDIALATVHAVQECRAGIDRLSEAAGMPLLYRANPLGRYQRALHALTQHAITSPLRMGELGAALLQPQPRHAD